MKKEELIENQYYRTVYDDGPSARHEEHIFRYEGTENKHGNIKIGKLGIIRYGNWDQGNCDFSDRWFDRMRLATQEEIEWLHTCNARGEYLRRNEAISDYKIY